MPDLDLPPPSEAELVELGKRIRQRRSDLGIKRAHLAARVGISEALLGFIEGGRNPSSDRAMRPSLDRVTHLAEALGLRNEEKDEWVALAGHAVPDREPGTNGRAFGLSLSQAVNSEQRLAKPDVYDDLEETEVGISGFLSRSRPVAEVPVFCVLNQLRPGTPLRILGVSAEAGVSLARLCSWRQPTFGDPESPGDSVPRADDAVPNPDAFAGQLVGTFGVYTEATVFLLRFLGDVPWELFRRDRSAPQWVLEAASPGHKPRIRSCSDRELVPQDGVCRVCVEYTIGGLISRLTTGGYRYIAVQAHPYVVRKSEFRSYVMELRDLDDSPEQYHERRFPSTLVVTTADLLSSNLHDYIISELDSIRRANQIAYHALLRPGAGPDISDDVDEFLIATDPDVFIEEPSVFRERLIWLAKLALPIGILDVDKIMIDKEVIVGKDALKTR